MNIILKQADIEKALRQYVERQGFSLRNKTFAVGFTHGRGDNGLSASVTIEDIEIPGYTDGNDMVYPAAQPSAAVQAMATVTPLQAVKEVAAVTAAAIEVDGQAEEAVLAPATLAEIKEAGIPVEVPAAVTAAFKEAEDIMAAASTKEPEANEEVKVQTEAAPTPVKTTSLFGS